MRPPRSVLVSALALALTLAPAARAQQPSPSDLSLAKALFEDGRKALAEGRVDAACAKLAQSYRLDPALGTLLNLAVCHEKQGRTATAWGEFNTAAEIAAKNKESKRRDFAAAQAADLGARLARLVVRYAGPTAGLSVRLDGREVGAAVIGTAMPLDPGEHRLEISAPGKRAFTAAVKLAPGPSTESIEVPALAAEAAPPPVAPPPVAPPPVAPPVAAPKGAPPKGAPPKGAGRSTPRLAAGVAVGAAGIAGVVVGSIFGVRTFQKRSDALAHGCDDVSLTCKEPGYTEQLDAHHAATISTVAFALGLTAAAAGVVLIVTSGSSAAPKASAWIAPAPAGFAAGARF